MTTRVGELVLLGLEDLEDLLEKASEKGARRVLSEHPLSGEWLGRDEVAAMIGCSPRYVSELVRDRGLPCQKVGRKARFRRDDVEKWMATYKVRK